MTKLAMKNLLNGREVQLTVTTLLLGAVINWPYGYFVFLRWVVCMGSAYCGWQAKQTGKIWWFIAFCGIAIAFNPIQPVYLHRDAWAWIDIASAVAFLVFTPATKTKNAE